MSTIARPFLTVHRGCVACALLLALACATAARGQSTTLLDTFGFGNTFTGTGTVPCTASTLRAVRFTVPTAGNMTLVSIDMALSVVGSVSSARIGIFNEFGNGLPVGMPIAFADIPGPLTDTPAFVSVPFPAGSTLAAAHTYWAAPIVTGTGLIYWGGGVTGTTTVAYYDGTNWAPETLAHPLAIRVNVTGTLTPCCNAHGTGCIMLLAPDCTTVGGVVVIDGPTCGSTACQTFVPGACCHGTSCMVETSEACAFFTPSGRFLGHATACTPVIPGGPNPCCPADFNNSGVLSVQDIFDYLTAWFAGCP